MQRGSCEGRWEGRGDREAGGEGGREDGRVRRWPGGREKDELVLVVQQLMRIAAGER